MTSAIDSPVESRRTRDTPHQKAWYWYDWANSAYVTTTLTVLMAPYLTVIAKKAACPTLPSDVACHTDLQVIGIPVDPGSLVFYVLTFSTIVSAIVLIFIGALADRSPRPVRLFAAFAWSGAAAATAMFLVSGDNWALGVVLLIFANLCLGSSLVIYDSLLCRIAGPDERDRVSSPRLGLGLPGWRPPSRAQPWALDPRQADRHLGADGGADQPALGRTVVGRLHDHPGHRPARPARSSR